MHTYRDYRPPSGEAVVDLVRRNPFAVIASSRPGAAPLATHTPVVLPPGSPVRESFVGHRLWGHLGRENPHWRLFAEQPEALLVFSSSHAYVSPSNYGFEPAAPTLNYAAVHLTGRLRIVEDEEESLAVVEQTVRALEALRPAQWSMDNSRGLFRKIIGGVVSFHVEVTSEQAMFKLSQDMSAEVHERVAEDLESPGCPHADVAGLMRATGIHAPPTETADHQDEERHDG